MWNVQKLKLASSLILLLMAAPCWSDQQGQVQTLEGHGNISYTLPTNPSPHECLDSVTLEWKPCGDSFILFPDFTKDYTVNITELEEALALALKWLAPSGGVRIEFMGDMTQRDKDINRIQDVYQRLKTINEANQKGQQ